MSDGLISKAYRAGIRGMKSGGDAIDGASKFTIRNRDRITAASREAVDAVGRTSEALGRGIQDSCNDLNSQRPTTSTQEEGIVGKAVAIALGCAISSGNVTGRSLQTLGGVTRKASPSIGEVTGSLITGTTSAISGTVDSMTISKSDFDELEVRLISAGQIARLRSKNQTEQINAARKTGDRDELYDLITIGGVTVAAMATGAAEVPVEVQRAFELAYPGLTASGQTFSDVAARLSADDAVGLVSGVKGKLFELELIDRLNGGGLGSGLHAELAGSVTQPGYDILIRDENGHTVDLLQAKATESVEYVRDALERYPGIDISTTSEVHGHMMTLGLTEHVSDSGISSIALQHKIEAAAGIGDHVGIDDFIPTSLGIAVIALTAFTKSDLTWEERASVFGDRIGKAGIAGIGAKTVMVATGAWWMTLVGGVGLRLMSSRGEAKRQRLDALRGIVEKLEMDNRKHTARASKVSQSSSPFGAGRHVTT